MRAYHYTSSIFEQISKVYFTTARYDIIERNTDEKFHIKELSFDILCAIVAGAIVGTAYYFFQNSNGFAPGGVGGLATITHFLLADKISWSVLMVAFNLPIFILVSAIVNKKLGLMLSIYMLVCIINKRQIGEMMRIIKGYPDTFASFEKVNEVFGNFKRKV